MTIADIGATVRAIEAAPVYEQPLVEIRGLVKHFPVKGGILQRTVAEVKAVDGVDLDDPARRERSGWSASRAAARPPLAGCCCA